MRRTRLFASVLTLLLALVLSSVLLPGGSRAAEIVASGTCGADLTWTLDSSGLLTVSGTGGMSTEPWVGYSSSIRKAVFEEGVKYISSYAFENCTHLSYVTIPASVEGIGVQAFEGCSSLTGVYIEDLAAWCGIDFAGYSANPLYYAGHILMDNGEVRELTIPSGVTSIGRYAFIGCEGITSVTIPADVEKIGRDAFWFCRGLTGVYIEDLAAWCGIEFEGYGANPLNYAKHILMDGQELTELTIPAGVTKVGNYAFWGGSSLTSVTVPDWVTEIGDGAFMRCGGLTAVYIDDLTAWCCIDFGEGGNPLVSAHHLYVNGAELTELTLPAGVTDVGSHQFIGGSSLTRVTLPEGVRSVGSFAFYGCSSLEDLSLPSSLTSIGECGFYGCSSLPGVTLPVSVTSFGHNAFWGCTGLTAVVIGDLASWCGIEFGGYDANPLYYAHRLILNGTELTALTVPEGVTEIGDYAFAGWSRLTDLTIPDWVRSVGISAFYGCSGLTAVTVPANVRSLGEYAFAKCRNLTAVTLPAGLTDIAPSLFYGCSGLTDVTIPAGVTSIGGDAFSCCTGLRSILLPDNVTSIESGAFYGCTQLADFKLPPRVTSIESYTFSDCTGLTTISIPVSVTSIDDEAFSGCTGLRWVNYGGREAQWARIAVGSGNEELTEAGFSFANMSARLPVHSEDGEAVEAEVVEQCFFAGMLPDIASGMQVLRGPDVHIAGLSFHLFETDAKLELPLKTLLSDTIEVEVDREKKTVNVTIGFEDDSSATVSGDPNAQHGQNDDFWKSYTQAKELVKSITGSTPNSAAFRSRFRSVSDKLKECEADLIVKASTKACGYVELSYESGELKFSEGGIVLAVSIKSTLNGRIPSFPAAYVTLRFEVSAEGNLRVVVNENRTYFDPAFEARLQAAVGVGLGKNTGQFQAYVEGGFEGTLGVYARPSGRFLPEQEDPFSADLTGNLYFSWKLKAWLLEAGDSYKKQLFKLGLYPELGLIDEGAKGSPKRGGSIYDDLQPVTRDYLKSPPKRGITDDYSFSRVEYPYAEPTLLTLSDGRLLLVWVGDDGTKPDGDRTSIFWSVYADGAWSEPAAVWESGTYNDHPVLCPDGELVHAVWMRADVPLEGMDAEDALSHLDLVYSAFDGSAWSEPVVISHAGNGMAETDYALAAADGDAAVIWVENVNNDLLTASGFNSMYLRCFENGAWLDATRILSEKSVVSGLQADMSGGLQFVCSLTKDGDTTTWHQSPDGSVNPMEENDGARWFDGSLYELRGTELYCEGEPTGLEGLTNYEVVSAGEQKAVLTLVPEGFACELFGSYYDAGTGSWGPWLQLTDYGKYIRSYSAVLDESGRIAAALNLVNVSPEAERIYDDASALLAVTADCRYTDLAVDEWLYFDAEQVIPGGTLPLSFRVTNNSCEVLTEITAAIGEQTFGLTCALAPGESGVLTVDYVLPEALDGLLDGLEIELYVTPDYDASENNTENNRVSAVIGLADLVVTASPPKLTESGAAVAVTVTNMGYGEAENTVLTVCRGNLAGEVLAEEALGGLAPGQTAEYVFDLPEDMLFLSDPAAMLALSFEASCDSAELRLSNNDDHAAFDSPRLFSVETEVSGEGLGLNVTVVNPGREEMSCLLAAAAYDENGRQLTAQLRPLLLSSEGSGEETFTFAAAARPLTLRVFLLNGETLAPLSPAWERRFPPAE